MTLPPTTGPTPGDGGARPPTTVRLPGLARRIPVAAATLPRPPRTWVLVLVGLVALHLGHPLTWSPQANPLWLPSLGIGLALTFWLGPWGALLAAADLLLVRLLAGGDISQAALDAALTGGELLLAWWTYLRLARGRVELDEPGSATAFLMLVPGLAGGLGAAARAALAPGSDFATTLGHLWVARGLSLLALGPPLLAFGTPWLRRLGLAPREAGSLSYDLPRVRTTGEAVEAVGLAFGAALLGVLLTARGPGAGVNWHLWATLLLVVVWAALRQGLQGGALAAACAAVSALLAAGPWPPLPAERFTIQGNLLALCSTAVLVGTSSAWIRASESRYRQVIGHIPVVLYSARLLAPPGHGASPRAAVTLVSPACAAVFGCPPEELLGDHERWLAQVHPEDRELVVAALAQLVLQDQPVTCEYRLLPRAGETDHRMMPSDMPGLAAAAARNSQVPRDRWVRDTLAPRHDDAGRLQGWDGVVEDITEPRHLSSSLRRTGRMLQALVTNLPAGVLFVQGKGGQPILVNARARQLLGQREDPSAGVAHFPRLYRLHRPDGTLYPWEELPVTRALQQGLTGMRDDIVVHRSDGRRVPLVTWAAPVDLYGSGEADAAVWVFEDLTALHQAESARLESQARLRAVVETMAEGLIVQDESGAVVEFNPAACAILGVPAEELGRRVSLGPEAGCLREDGTPLPPGEHPHRAVLRTHAAVRNVVIGIPFPEQGAAGKAGTPQPACGAAPARVRWILVNALPLEVPGKQRGIPAYRVVSTFADVTAYREALAVLRASEEKYRALVEALPLMVVQIDRQGRITYRNPATERLVGEAPAGPGDFWEALVHRDDLGPVRAAQARVLAGEPARAEFRYRTKDSAEKVGYVLATPLWHDGQVAGATLLVVDQTLQRRLEKDLGRVQRLELVGRLASGVVHDFNNLLTVVLSLAEVARSGLPDGHPALDDLRGISDAAEQAGALAAQLLAFSKQRRVELYPVALNHVVSRSLGLLRRSLPASVTLDQDLASALPPVRADEGQLQQVLMNLCLNARDAMPRGGTLTVRTSLGAPPAAGGTGDAPGAWVCLSVADTGQGMDRAVLGQVFEPFFSTKERGTGLGLAVVRQLVESFSGRIEVWSESGQGTRFDVWLPALREG